MGLLPYSRCDDLIAAVSQYYSHKKHSKLKTEVHLQGNHPAPRLTSEQYGCRPFNPGSKQAFYSINLHILFLLFPFFFPDPENPKVHSAAKTLMNFLQRSNSNPINSICPIWTLMCSPYEFDPSCSLSPVPQILALRAPSRLTYSTPNPQITANLFS